MIKKQHLAAFMAVVLFACGPKSNKQSDQKEAVTNETSVEKPLQNAIDNTAFFEACLNGELEKVQYALDNGLAVDALDAESRTGLMLAAFNGHSHVVKLLLERGANVLLGDPL